jgi:mitochondrial fission protein ELM1
LDQLPENLTCWVMSDGKPGMENQCLGLAESMDLDPVVKRLVIRNPWASLPPQLWLAPFRALGPLSDLVAPPWPDLLIATGRQTVALSRWIRRLSHGRTFTVQIQNPAVRLSEFDLVVTPKHDRQSGANVIETFGALNRVSAETIETAARAFAAGVADLPRPLTVVLLGGSNKVYEMTPESSAELAGHLRRLVESTGGGLAITPSRRTGEGNIQIIRNALSGLPVKWHRDGEPNPYLGWMGLADAFVTTSDSVNMASEACGTGKPVFVHHLPGGAPKFQRFHTALQEAGMTRALDGHLAHWTYPPLNDTATVATEVQARLLAHLQQLDTSST